MEMWLFKREKTGTYYIEFKRGHKRSLKTNDKVLANRLYVLAKREYLAGQIRQLDKHKTISLKDFLGEYLTYSSARKQPKTVKADSLAMRKLIDFLGGSISLRSIKTPQLDQFIANCIKSGQKPSGVNVYLRHLKSAFNRAVIWEYVSKNPFHYILLLKVKKAPPRYLTIDEIKKILDVIDDPEFKDFFLVYIYSGIRRAELLNLQSSHITPTHLILTDTKTGGFNYVPIHPLAEPIMDKYRGKVGRIWRWKHPDTVTHLFKKYALQAGIEDVNLHKLRHTFASHLAMAGISLKQISELLGHSDTRMTDKYAHLSPDSLSQTISQLDYAPKMHPQAKLKIVK